MTRVFLIAGEPSGDRLGASLLRNLNTLQEDLQVDGVGGPLMIAEGLQSRFDMSELSVMGITEVLPKLPKLLSRVGEMARAIEATQPDVLVTIDSPDFCLRVAAKAKAARPSLKTVHYVAPSVWAWREDRADKMARSIDHVLALLPFEPPYMQAAGMTCDFVGHPVVADPQPTARDVNAFKTRHGLIEGAPIVLALPGSRRSEIDRLADIFGRSLAQVVDQHPSAQIIVPTVAAQTDRVRAHVKRWPGRTLVLDPAQGHPQDKACAFAAADVALAASGTVSLELAASDTPMVIAYDMNWISRRLIASKLKIDTVTLVNLVAESRTVPEFLGEACNPAAISRALLDVMVPGGDTAQWAAMALTMERLGAGGEDPGLRAARSVLAQL